MEEEMITNRKLKLKPTFESQLNFIYNTYVLEDDNNLDEGAKELKEHYKYVIEDMKLHDDLTEVEGIWKKMKI